MNSLSFINYTETKQYSIWYMQKRKNMTGIAKFVYVNIIFLSIFLFATIVEGKQFLYLFQKKILSSYTTFYHIFVTMFFFNFFSLQVILDVFKILNVQYICVPLVCCQGVFMDIVYVLNWWYRLYEQKSKRVQKCYTKIFYELLFNHYVDIQPFFFF